MSAKMKALLCMVGRRTGVRRLALACALALGAAGCGLFELPGSTRGEFHLGRKTLAVLPFATRGRSYFESKLGARFSRMIAREVSAEWPRATVQDADRLPASFRQRGARALGVGEVIGDADAAGIGEALGADYLVVGEIHELRGKDPKSFGVLQGTMVVSARLVDVERGRVVWQLSRHAFHYPPPISGGELVPAREKDEAEVVRKVMLEAARGIAVPFTGRELTTGERVERAVY